MRSSFLDRSTVRRRMADDIPVPVSLMTYAGPDRKLSAGTRIGIVGFAVRGGGSVDHSFELGPIPRAWPIFCIDRREWPQRRTRIDPPCNLRLGGKGHTAVGL